MNGKQPYTAKRTCGLPTIDYESFFLVVSFSKYYLANLGCFIPHRIHGAGIYANMTGVY